MLPAVLIVDLLGDEANFKTWPFIFVAKYIRPVGDPRSCLVFFFKKKKRKGLAEL